MGIEEWQSLTLAQAKDKISKHKSGLEHREILHMLNTLKIGKNVNPTTFKVGDVFMHAGLRHPAVILKISNDFVDAVILTTEESCTNILMKCNSRFYADSYFTATISRSNLEHIQLHGVYDNIVDIKEVKKLLKQYYKKLLRI